MGGKQQERGRGRKGKREKKKDGQRTGKEKNVYLWSHIKIEVMFPFLFNYLVFT